MNDQGQADMPFIYQMALLDQQQRCMRLNSVLEFYFFNGYLIRSNNSNEKDITNV
jgi:hypothetical protein